MTITKGLDAGIEEHPFQRWMENGQSPEWSNAIEDQLTAKMQISRLSIQINDDTKLMLIRASKHAIKQQQQYRSFSLHIGCNASAVKLLIYVHNNNVGDCQRFV